MPDPQHAGDADDPRLAALMAWRQRLIDSGAVSKTGFKETHLRLILRSGRTDVDQIRAMLPGSVADYAEELAALLTENRAERGLSAVEPPAARPVGTERPAPATTRGAPLEAPLGPRDFAVYAFGPTPFAA